MQNQPIESLSRREWLSRLFPEGTVPQLWCPPLTHYLSSGEIDSARIAAHLRFISPWVKGLLVPGSTGDGWELTLNVSHVWKGKLARGIDTVVHTYPLPTYPDLKTVADLGGRVGVDDRRPCDDRFAYRYYYADVRVSTA